MRIIFRVHIFLRIGGRLFTLLMILCSIVLIIMDVKFAVNSSTYDLVFMFFVTIAFCFICYYINSYLWQLCWGKLIVEDDKVIWRCLFYKSVKIFYSEIKFFCVREFREGNVAYYKNAGDQFKYVLILSKDLPKKRLDKIKSGKGLIKFRYTKELMQSISNKINHEK